MDNNEKLTATSTLELSIKQSIDNDESEKEVAKDVDISDDIEVKQENIEIDDEDQEELNKLEEEKKKKEDAALNEIRNHVEVELPLSIKQYVRRYHRYYNPDILQLLDALFFIAVGIVLLVFSYGIVVNSDAKTHDESLTTLLFYVITVIAGIHGLVRAKQLIAPIIALMFHSYKCVTGRVTHKFAMKVREADRVVRDHYFLRIDGLDCETLSKADYEKANIGDTFVIISICEQFRYCVSVDMNIEED